MMSIFNKLRLENFKATLKEVGARFPVPVLAIIITFLLFVYQISVDDLSDFVEDILFKSIISSIVVFFLSTAVVLMSESLNKSFFSKEKSLKGGSFIYQILSVIFGFLFYYFFGGQTLNFFSSEEIVYIFLIYVGIISFLFFSPFIKNVVSKKFSQEIYYNYFIKISFIFLISFILGGTLTILGFIGLSAIFALFDLNSLNESDYYSYFATFSLILFTPLFFLSQLPKKILKTKKIDIHSFFKFLIKFVGIPTIFIYFLILYAYTIKVLLNFNEWPHGEVSWMVIGFSIFGYLVYIFSYEFEKKNRFIKNIRKFFPFVVLPQILMLFYAIFLRINQYDFTINRYFVVVFGLWLTVISLYLIFSKKKILAFIPMILFDFIIVISIGPWSVYNFPEGRQISILNENLIEASILVDGEIIIPDEATDIDNQISGKVYDVIGYLVNNHGIKSIGDIFPKLIEEIKIEDKKEWEKNNKLYNEVEYYGISTWTLIDKLRTKLKIRAYYPGKEIEKKYIIFSLDYNFINGLIEIKGYDYMFELSGGGSRILTINNIYSANIDIDNEKIILYKSGKILEEFNISKDLRIFYEENKDYLNNYGEIKLDEAFEIEKFGDELDIKIILSSFSILNPNYTGDDEYSNFFFNGKVLIKEK